MTNLKVKNLSTSQHQDSIHQIFKLKDDTFSAFANWSINGTVNSKAKSFINFKNFVLEP